MSQNSEPRPKCGCGKEWPLGALRLGALCIHCGESSPPLPVERIPLPERIMFTDGDDCTLVAKLHGGGVSVGGVRLLRREAIELSDWLRQASR